MKRGYFVQLFTHYFSPLFGQACHLTLIYVFPVMGETHIIVYNLTFNSVCLCAKLLTNTQSRETILCGSISSVRGLLSDKAFPCQVFMWTALRKENPYSHDVMRVWLKQKRRHHLQSASVLTALPLLTSVKTHRAPFTGWPFQRTYCCIASNDIGFSQHAFWVVTGSQDSFVAQPGWRSIFFPRLQPHTQSTEHRAPCRLWCSPYRPLQLHFLRRQAQWACSFQWMINLLISLNAALYFQTG